MKKIIGLTTTLFLLFPVFSPVKAFADELTNTTEETTEIVEIEGEGDSGEITELPPIIEIVPPIDDGQDDSEEIDEPDPTDQDDGEETPTEPKEPIENLEPIEIPEDNQSNVVESKEVNPVVETPTPSQTPENGSFDSYAPMSFSRNMTTEQFVMSIAEQAREVGQEKDIYASVMIAQAILESGSGSSELSSPPNHNLFGIKGEYNGNGVSYLTYEDDGSGNLYPTQASFRVYADYKESLNDYAELLKGGLTWDNNFYAGTWKSNTTSYQDATAYLQGTYATDTSYAAKLDEYIETYDLTQYDNPKIVSEETKDQREAVLNEAEKYLGIPYVWGGKDPSGFDCSGLVSWVYRYALGMDFIAYTVSQEVLGQEVSLSDLEMGDLLFWGDSGASHHVAIYIGGGQYIHAPQTGEVVKVANLDFANFSPDFARRLIE